MGTTKRTSATSAYDVNGRRIRLLKTRITSNRGHNRLSYDAIRQAFADRDDNVFVDTGDYGLLSRRFGALSASIAYSEFDAMELDYDATQTYFAIGCHVFTLKMFNRILRAAGVRTTKPQTLKTFAAAA